MPGGLDKDMLTWEPLRMIHMKQAEIKDEKLQPAAALHILELSNLDQLFDFYNSVALFYDSVDAGKNSNGMLVQRLEGALEELLVHYPAAAGRLRIGKAEGRMEVEYYSAPYSRLHADPLYGVPFAVAHANIALCELGDVSAPHPSLDLLYACLPEQRERTSGHGRYLPRPVLAVQVTTFTCGGFVLAHAGHHAFMDGHGAATLLQNLCSIARGAGLTVYPESLSRREVMKPTIPITPPVVSRHPGVAWRAASADIQIPYGEATRFAFSAAALETLRQRAGSGQGQPCSRYVALAALLWTARVKSQMMISTSPPPPSQEMPLCVAVNLREKGAPGLTRGYVGNAVLLCIVTATLQELCSSPLPYVASMIKSTLAGMDLAERAQSEIDCIESKLRSGLVPSVDQSILGITSLVNLPFYDTDCGWGCPIYCGRPSRQLAERLLILDHPAARAWNVLVVFNTQEERAFFQEEIAAYIISTSASS